ncbi:type II toxin-antitoxin system HigB family toxin [Cruoricaptor ignavus]|uniref:Type II toxin-antitoxin system HigB family toxin n=1 Tax=Cruoricaptor ignavus TaxID=1118202 RepID=A0A7M1T466_9FLAO|nr:type II toxin-antitoxin system HigB family toxin [Cruoricaptor ignavus]QOR74676.1 type II toxin-antitoxin system HigB family toxin [Cruoricaptor ignavus]
MRIIAVRTLKRYCEKYPLAEQSLLAWFAEAEKAEWRNPQALKSQFANASILDDKRVVFNIHGNKFRLIVDIEYRIGLIFIVWFGQHKDYDRIDAKNINYDKAD